MAAAFAEKDMLAIVTSLNTCHTLCSNRRASQDMTAYPLYLSQSEWEMAKCNVEAAIGVSIDVIVHRLGGVNVDEPTLKRISSLALALFNDRHSFLGVDVKAATLLQVKQSYRRTARVVKDLQKTKPSSIPYIVKLPSNPADLEKAHPLAGFKIEGCWTDPIVNMPDVDVLDSSYRCRQPKKKSTTASIMQYVFACKDMRNGQGRARDLVDDECHLRAQSSNKRSLRELMQLAPKKPRRSSSELAIELGEDAEAAAATQESAQTAPSSLKLALVLNDASQATATTAAATAAEDTTAAAITTVASPASESKEPLATMGSILLDAMMQRDRASRDAIQIANRMARQMAKVAATRPEFPISAATPEKPPKKAPPSASVAKSPHGKPQKPSVSHEASRSQWLARSANNGSKTFKYGVKREFLTDSKAKAAAEAWLAEQKQ